MKKLLTFIISILISTTVYATVPAITFVNDLTDDIIQNVLESNKSQDEKLITFRTAFEKALDLKSIGQFVLGVYWRQASETDREAFLKAFIDYTTKTWADRFNMYNGQKIIFLGTRNAERNQLYVDSQIQNNPPVEVIWRLRQKNGDFRIIDIIVEGVSMAMSYRNEYSAFLQAHAGKVSALTKELEEKSASFQFSDTTQN